jgi:hypothetical protein
MKTIAALLGLFTTIITSSAVVTTVGGPIYNPASGHNYYLVSSDTWTGAQNYALTLGGNLVTINDAAENAWLKAAFLDPNPTINPWIGLHDIDNNNIWEWISGEPVSYLNWAPGEPNFSFERVSNIFPANHSLAGLWNNAYDDVSSGVLFGIVEVPEPSYLALGLISGATLMIARQRRPA